MRHTIVVEIPDAIVDANQAWRESHGKVAVADLPRYIEGAISGAIGGRVLRVAGHDFRPTVIEYHHEQMTQPSED